jgi:hypothetical protein
VYTTNIFGIMKKRGQIDAIYTNLSKAFNSVNHDLLLNKCITLGISNPLMSRFGFFSTDRTQNVKNVYKVSSFYSVPFSILQGGHLSLLLFLLFKNVYGNKLIR